MMKKVLIFGGSGFIGQSIKNHLIALGYEVFLCSRSAKKGDVLFSLEESNLTESCFEDFDIWIHLAGENIQGWRWTRRKKRKILFSRLLTNERLRQIYLQLKNPPQQIFIASGVGYYSPDSHELIDEKTPKGDGFLSQVASKVEEGWQLFPIQPIFLRIAPVLASDGGVIERLKIFFKLKCLLYFSSSNNYFPYITIDQFVDSLLFLFGKNASGPINFVSKKPLKQKELFLHILGSTPWLSINIPKWFIQVALGQMGEETVCVNQKVIPQKLIDLGFQFDDSFYLDRLKNKMKSG